MPALVLAEVSEVWSAEPVGHRYRHETGPIEMAPTDLIDQHLVLDHWLDEDGEALPNARLIIDPERALCFRDTDDHFLVDQEYEGYMGNYGETLQYWYRRAAVVVQSPEIVEIRRFTSDFDTALDNLLALARNPAREAEFVARFEAVKQTLGNQRQKHGIALLPAYAELAIALPNDEQALGLCAGIDWRGLAPTDAAVLAQLQAVSHSPTWKIQGQRLLEHIRDTPEIYPRDRLGPLCLALPTEVMALPIAQALRAAVIEFLRLALATPALDQDDHSMPGIAWTCRCTDCRPVITWAESSTGQSLTLAVPEQRRTHIISVLRAAGSRITTQVVKKGSPYRLLLGKPVDLHAQRSSQRQHWTTELASLTESG